MHTATHLARSTFTVEVDHDPGSVDDLFPGWHRHDRVGIVISNAYGVVGASLLMQVAALLFYEADERRRWEQKQYPELYAFHAGGPHGDVSMFDVFPGRKEVVVPGDADALLAAINERAITRLIVPDSRPANGSHTYSIHERHPALNRIASAFAYSRDGRVHGSDVTVTGSPGAEFNVTMTLDPERLIRTMASWTQKEHEAFIPQLRDEYFAAGGFDVEEYVRRRAAEVPESVRSALLAERQQTLDEGSPRETYRRIPVEEALDLVAAAADAQGVGGAPA